MEGESLRGRGGNVGRVHTVYKRRRSGFPTRSGNSARISRTANRHCRTRVTQPGLCQPYARVSGMNSGGSVDGQEQYARDPSTLPPEFITLA